MADLHMTDPTMPAPTTTEARSSMARDSAEAIIDRVLGLPVVWGVSDCVTFAAQVSAAWTGADVLAELPDWETERQAARVVAGAGGDLGQAIGRVLEGLGWLAVPPAEAPAGALGVLRRPDGIPVAAACLGARWVARLDRGVTFRLGGDIERAWAPIGGMADG